jgi:hypothetical protein
VPGNLKGGGRAVALAILCTLLFLTFLDNTIVSVGLGSVQADLHAGVQALQWRSAAITVGGLEVVSGDGFGPFLNEAEPGARDCVTCHLGTSRHHTPGLMALSDLRPPLPAFARERILIRPWRTHSGDDPPA